MSGSATVIALIRVVLELAPKIIEAAAGISRGRVKEGYDEVQASLDTAIAQLEAYCAENPDDEEAREVLASMNAAANALEENEDSVNAGVEVIKQFASLVKKRDGEFEQRSKKAADSHREWMKGRTIGMFVGAGMAALLLSSVSCASRQYTREYVDDTRDPVIVVVEFPVGVGIADIRLVQTEGFTQATFSPPVATPQATQFVPEDINSEESD